MSTNCREFIGEMHATLCWIEHIHPRRCYHEDSYFTIWANSLDQLANSSEVLQKIRNSWYINQKYLTEIDVLVAPRCCRNLLPIPICFQWAYLNPTILPSEYLTTTVLQRNALDALLEGTQTSTAIFSSIFPQTPVLLGQNQANCNGCSPHLGTLSPEQLENSSRSFQLEVRLRIPGTFNIRKFTRTSQFPWQPLL